MALCGHSYTFLKCRKSILKFDVRWRHEVTHFDDQCIKNLVKERQTTDHLISGKKWSRDKENMNEKHATAGNIIYPDSLSCVIRKKSYVGGYVVDVITDILQWSLTDASPFLPVDTAYNMCLMLNVTPLFPCVTPSASFWVDYFSIFSSLQNGS